LDEAPFPGRVLAASAKTGVPIGYLSLGPRIPDDLARPGLDGLVDSVLRPREGLAA
jgi:flagellar biosynthesis GTPase FlhF